MQSLLLLLSLFCFPADTPEKAATQQAPVKVFQTYEDFRNQHFSLAADTFATDNGTTGITASAVRLAIWGIQQGQRLYRLMGNKWYAVADTSGLVIYTLTQSRQETSSNITWIPVPLGKAFPSGFPMQQYTTADVTEISYYFSRGLDDSLLNPLDRQTLTHHVNLPDFTAAINKTFRWYQRDISSYDRKKQRYLVNTIYNEYGTIAGNH